MNLTLIIPAAASKDDAAITDRPSLSALDGVTHDEVFSEYLIDHPDPYIRPADIASGKLALHFNTKEGVLQARVTYELKNRLNPDEARALTKYTLEQLSDGIGENFSQDYDGKTGVFIHFSDKVDQVRFEYGVID